MPHSKENEMGRYALAKMLMENQRRQEMSLKEYAKKLAKRIEDELPTRRSLDRAVRKQAVRLYGLNRAKIRKRSTVKRQLRGEFRFGEDQQ